MQNYVNYRYYYARFDQKNNTFDIGHEKYGIILSNCTFHARTRNVLNHTVRHIQISEFGNISTGYEKHVDGKCLTVCFSNGPEELPFIILRISIRNNEVVISYDTQTDSEYSYHITGQAIWGKTPETDTFAVYTNYTGKGLRAAIGPAAGRGCDSLFDRQTDSMLTLSGSPAYRYDYETGVYQFTMPLKNEDMSFKISIKENILTDQYAFRSYKPMNNNTVFERPPVGWMTWYALAENSDEKAICDITHVQKEKLQAYGANAVWIDWEWYHVDEGNWGEGIDTFHPDPDKYPNGLRCITDKIREDGFVPCLWIGPTHDVRENEFLKDCPEALLIKRKTWCGDWWFDPTHPRYLNEFLPRVMRMMTEEWGFDAFKWDCFPRSLDYYDQYHDKLFDSSLTAEQALREVEKKAREVIGDKVYLLSCHGEGDRDVTLSTDIFDAARIGADIYTWPQFLEWGIGRLYRYYPLHNVVFYCDPDNLVIRSQYATENQAISKASLFSLLGTPITLGDNLKELPDERIEIIRRAIPPVNTHPMILENLKPDSECEIINTFVRTRWDEYQIADIINLTERPLKYELKFADLDLEPETDYLVYDFWNHEFLGKYRHSLELELQDCQSRVLLIRKVLEHPQLVSTSRHITQGAFDIEELVWDAEKSVLSGVSKTIPGEAYTITAYNPLTNEPVIQTITPDSEKTCWAINFL